MWFDIDVFKSAIIMLNSIYYLFKPFALEVLLQIYTKFYSIWDYCKSYILVHFYNTIQFTYYSILWHDTFFVNKIHKFTLNSCFFSWIYPWKEIRYESWFSMRPFC